MNSTLNAYAVKFEIAKRIEHLTKYPPDSTQAIKALISLYARIVKEQNKEQNAVIFEKV